MLIHARVRSLVLLLTVALLNACAGITASSTVPSQPGALFPAAATHLAPAACHGQKTTATYATAKQTLLKSGGVLCVPSFGGFGGSLEYPSADPSVTVTLTTSTTNYNGKLKGLGKGKPMLYIQIVLSGSTLFGTHTPAGGGVVGSAFKSGSTYTGYGGAIVPIVETLGSCTAVAKASKYGGQISGLGSLLKHQYVPAITGVVEIYAGKQSSKGSC